ncbi:xylulokinase [Frondihabitans australicus]|uniref:Sugar (Pentulose or hexulose) kinase n=1 Tax=Frondihabitans australicus TaxID=386892 RepID=A0A495IBT9_9MICO|nr:FGGY-family carbohydrate kinase [Frondihabitans australicus]RKR72948.1 sugar (pentulose or hexulose) kinase [Frondihabitans australicus]
MTNTDPASTASPGGSTARLIADGRATLGIELGSTRIKACLIDDSFETVASGSFEWENENVDGVWTYGLDTAIEGLQAAYADLVADVQKRYDTTPTSFAAIGISAMMHGYLATDAAGELLVPFRTWRNSSTGVAAAELTEALDFNIPLRWSIAHLVQAAIDREEHVPRVASVTTLGGWVHRALTGRDVLGVGDASGVFPIDPATRDYDERMLDIAQQHLAEHAPAPTLREVLPEVLEAGADAGSLTPDGAKLLDPSGRLKPGIPFCPPEGDAGTGMVATNSVAQRTGNVSVGTSIFAMIVLAEPLKTVHQELDVVTTPTGDAVAMVHCNNGASEIGAWARVFSQFAAALPGAGEVDQDAVFQTLLDEALTADADAGGLLSFNYLAGEPVTGVEEGRPLLLRTPTSRFTLGNLVRSEVDAAFATLAIGMEALADEEVEVDRLLAHGGLFRTPGAAQQLLAAALKTPISVQATASEGGAWGVAVLAAYLAAASEKSLAEFLDDNVFAGAEAVTETPDPTAVAGFESYLARFRAALPLQGAAAAATPA